MRESFVFFKSFLDAIEEIDEKKQLKLYKSIAKFAIYEEKPTNLKGIEKAIFALIEPQITASSKRYDVSKECAQFGKMGGRPKKEKTLKGFENKTLNVNDNVNDNDNDNDNVNVNDNVCAGKKEKPDLFINPIKIFFEETYQKEFGTKPRLSQMDCNRIIELSAANSDIKELIPIAIRRLKNIEFEDINYTPTATWLLKSNNFERVINGEFERKKSQAELYRERRQLCESS